jgi:hypothetical protein
VRSPQPLNKHRYLDGVLRELEDVLPLGEPTVALGVRVSDDVPRCGRGDDLVESTRDDHIAIKSQSYGPIGA